MTTYRMTEEQLERARGIILSNDEADDIDSVINAATRVVHELDIVRAELRSANIKLDDLAERDEQWARQKTVMIDTELPEFIDPEPIPVLLLVARAALWPMSGTRKARVRDLLPVLKALGYWVLDPVEIQSFLADLPWKNIDEPGETFRRLIGDYFAALRMLQRDMPSLQPLEVGVWVERLLMEVKSLREAAAGYWLVKELLGFRGDDVPESAVRARIQELVDRASGAKPE